MSVEAWSSLPATLRRAEVITPENVPFEFEVAGFASRAMAWVIDGLITIALTMALSFLTLFLSAAAIAFFGELGFGATQAVQLALLFVVQWGYSVFFEWWMRGQTPGKRAMGLRVVSDDGLPLTFSQSVIRNLLRPVDSLPFVYLVGGLSVWIDARGRRLGDLAAGTMVIAERKAPVPDAFVAPEERQNSFLGDPAVAMAARRISAPERRLMISLGLRRDRLPLDTRAELFGRLAELLEGRVGIPRPSHLSPERYVLNLAAAMLARGETKPESRTRPRSPR